MYKDFFGFYKFYSATSMPMGLGLPSSNAALFNVVFTFNNRVSTSVSILLKTAACV